jgi:hypothetical protein
VAELCDRKSVGEALDLGRDMRVVSPYNLREWKGH